MKIIIVVFFSCSSTITFYILYITFRYVAKSMSHINRMCDDYCFYNKSTYNVVVKQQQSFFCKINISEIIIGYL